jgi:hypothetical protein
MPILQYETRISPEGYITLPPIPEYHDRKVVVRVHEEIERKITELSEMTGKIPEQDFLDFCEELDTSDLNNWHPDPAIVRDFFECRIPLDVELTDDEIETLKHERRMRKML